MYERETVRLLTDVLVEGVSWAGARREGGSSAVGVLVWLCSLHGGSGRFGGFRVTEVVSVC